MSSYRGMFCRLQISHKCKVNGEVFSVYKDRWTAYGFVAAHIATHNAILPKKSHLHYEKQSFSHPSSSLLRHVTTNKPYKNAPCCGCLSPSEPPWLYTIHQKDSMSMDTKFLRLIDKCNWVSKFKHFILKLCRTSFHHSSDRPSILSPGMLDNKAIVGNYLLDQCSDKEALKRAVQCNEGTQQTIPGDMNLSLLLMTDSDAEKQKNVHAALENIYSRLGMTLQDFFVSWPEFSMYNSNILFENSLFGIYTRGLIVYKFQVHGYRLLCKLVLANPQFVVLKISKDPDNRTIRVRWQTSGLPRIVKIFRRSVERRYYDFFSVLRVGESERIEFHLLTRVNPTRTRQTKGRLAKFFGIFGLAERLVHPGEINEEPSPVIPSSAQSSFKRLRGLGSCWMEDLSERGPPWLEATRKKIFQNLSLWNGYKCYPEHKFRGE